MMDRMIHVHTWPNGLMLMERNPNLNGCTCSVTLDVIPMNWYLETELHHGTSEWDILREGFIMKFSFEDGFDCIDEALQEVKASIFRIPLDPLDLIQPDWIT